MKEKDYSGHDRDCRDYHGENQDRFNRPTDVQQNAIRTTLAIETSSFVAAVSSAACSRSRRTVISCRPIQHVQVPDRRG
jgi:hypothetical protein